MSFIFEELTDDNFSESVLSKLSLETIKSVEEIMKADKAELQAVMKADKAVAFF